jgi:hypothetical protein
MDGEPGDWDRKSRDMVPLSKVLVKVEETLSVLPL